MWSGAPPATPRTPKPGKPFPVKLVMLAGGAFFVSVLFCAGLVLLFSGGKPDKKNGTLRITNAKWSMGDKKAKPGQHHNLLIWIERVDFQGPVNVYLKNLPPGVVCKPVPIPINNVRIE